MLKGRDSKIVFMLLAGLIILLHAITPHHHHYDTIESHPEDLECETIHTESHNENPDTHCHAFNLIFSDNGNDLTIKLSIENNLSFDLFEKNTELDFAPKLYEVNYTHRFLFFPLKQVFLTNHSLRAPPATV